MNRIKDAFINKKALIACLMAGDPNLEATARYMITAQKAGADMVEIGIPFSDPVAEGEEIQAAGERALAAGTTLAGIFDMAASIKGQMRIPMVFMTYANPVFVYGYDRFFARCADTGICGVIISDMPFEEQGEVKSSAGKYGVDIITLIAPASKIRMAQIAENAEGFICVDSSADVSEIKKYTDVPVVVNLDISAPAQAKGYSAAADGVIAGGGIARIIAKHGDEAENALYEYIRALKIQ